MAIRPSNHVNVRGTQARVVHISRKRQGGAWVRVFSVQFDETHPVRRFRAGNIQLAM